MSGTARKKISAALLVHESEVKSRVENRVDGTFATVFAFVKKCKKGEGVLTITMATLTDVVRSGSSVNTIVNFDHVSPVNFADTVRPHQRKILADVNNHDSFTDVVTSFAIMAHDRGYNFKGIFSTDSTAEGDLEAMEPSSQVA